MARLARPPPDEQQRPGQDPPGPHRRPARRAAHRPRPVPVGPFLCYLTIDGLHRTDPGNLIALRGRIHAAARTAAEGRATTYHATDSTITIGIRGPDAADRINQLRHALAKLITKHGWTTRDQPR